MSKTFLPLLLILFVMTGCGCNSNDGKKCNDTIIIGLDDAYAPFGFKDEHGKLVGFDIDFAKEVAKRMGVEVKFKGIDWSKKYDELESGNIDIIWSGFNVMPERKEHVMFSKPYMENRQVILVAKGKGAGIISVADLAGKIVGTQLASPAYNFINQDEELKNSFGKYITYDNYEHAFGALMNGKLDAVICDELVVHYEMIRHHDKFDVIETTVGSATDIAVGFRKSDTELLERFQNAFDEMIEDKIAQEISLKWFQADLIKTHQ